MIYNHWKRTAITEKNTLLFVAVSPKHDQVNRNCRLWFQQALSYHTLWLTDMFHFYLCFLTPCPYFTCCSHDHSMTLNYKISHFDSTKYKWPLYGAIQLITEVFIDYQSCVKKNVFKVHCSNIMKFSKKLIGTSRPNWWQYLITSYNLLYKYHKTTVSESSPYWLH